MSENNAEPVGLETPEDDAMEQHTSVREEEQNDQTWTIQLPFDANEADATEQERLVELDEDDYR
jgi:hypothetical protein